jgi:hypothetical protein
MTHVNTIGTNVATTGVSSLAVTLTHAVSTGHTVLGALLWEAGGGGGVPTISSIVDSRGNTWTTTPDASGGGATNTTVAVAIVRARITTALQIGDTITVTISGGTRSKWAAQFDDFDDVNSSSPKDQTATTGNTAPSGTSLTTGATSATAQAYELLYSVFGCGFGKTFTIPSGWAGSAKVETGATSGHRDLQTAWKYTASTGAQTGTMTIDSSSTYAACVAAYKATSLAPPVGQVSQAKLVVPAAAVPPVAQVSQVKVVAPVGVMGVVQVAQAKLRVPTLAGQAPYSGIKGATEAGTFVDSRLYAAQDGAV